MIDFAKSCKCIKTTPFHPYVFALFSISSLFASNFPDIPIKDVIFPLLVVIIFTILILFVMRFFFTSKAEAAIATTYVLFLSFFYTHFCVIFETVFSSWIRYLRLRYSLSGWLVFIILGLIWLRLSNKNSLKITIVLNLISILLVMSSFSMICLKTLSDFSELRLRWHNGMQSTENEISLKMPKKARDIYYLVFDRYPNNKILKDFHGYDNSLFYESLQERGFFVATNSWTNYPRTVISMASALNMTYHNEKILGDTYYGKMIQNHKVGRLLTSQGYKYMHIGNFYNPLRFNKNAVYNHKVSIFPSEFADIVYSMTPISRIWPYGMPIRILSFFGIDRFGGYSLLSQMNTLENIISMKGPKFVYAHFLPHHNNVLGESFVGRTKFVNKKILEMIDNILKISQPSPIIVIQADEGPYLDKRDNNLNRIKKIKKRTGIISAFYLPYVNMPGAISSTISPVNTFRLIFKEYFNADIDLLNDRIFYWENDSIQQLGTPGPGKFIEVTKAVLGEDGNL